MTLKAYQHVMNAFESVSAGAEVIITYINAIAGTNTQDQMAALVAIARNESTLRWCKFSVMRQKRRFSCRR